MHSSKLFFLILLVPCKSREQYKLTCPTDCWPNKISSCDNQGEKERTFKYNLPHIGSIGLSYYAFDLMTTIRARFGYLKFKTEAVKKSDISALILNTYENTEDGKIYSKTHGYTTACDSVSNNDKCEQSVSVNVTLKIFNGGAVMLDLGVNAASYNADSCASVKVCLESFTINQ